MCKISSIRLLGLAACKFFVFPVGPSNRNHHKHLAPHPRTTLCTYNQAIQNSDKNTRTQKCTQECLRIVEKWSGKCFTGGKVTILTSSSTRLRNAMFFFCFFSIYSSFHSLSRCPAAKPASRIHTAFQWEINNLRNLVKNVYGLHSFGHFNPSLPRLALC